MIYICVFICLFDIYLLSLQAKTNKYKIMKEKIKDFGEFNGWRGCMGLYFNTKTLRTVKKYGITSSTTLQNAYKILSNI